MIIKNMDEYAAELATIERLLLSDPPELVAKSLQHDRATILSNLQHKRDAAYHLDFYFSDTPDWVVLHDLRLEMGDVTASFDHLLIGREMNIYVIDTRHYNARLRINEEKEFSYYIDNRPVATDSPVERNQQRIDFLTNYLAGNGLLPTRFGLAIRPNFHNVVLVSPGSSIYLPREDMKLGCKVARSDHFLEKFSKTIPRSDAVHDFVALARQVSAENLSEMAEKLARRHIPRRIDFSQRYGLQKQESLIRAKTDDDSVEQCAACQKRITARVVRYCYDNRELFAGKAYCFDCQKGIAFRAVM